MYSIAKYQKNYYANSDKLDAVTDDRGNILTFDSKNDAEKWIDDNGATSTEYYIAETSLVEYIGRDADGSQYDWDNCECDCGECDTCLQHMVLQDLALIKSNK